MPPERTTEEIQQEIAKLHEAMAPLQQQQSVLYAQLRDSHEARSEAMFKAAVPDRIDPKTIDWKAILFLLGNNIQISRGVHREATALFGLFDMSVNGYNPATKQGTPRIKVTQSPDLRSFALNLAGLRTFLPVMQTFDCFRVPGRVSFSIFESTLSQYGSYTASVDPSDETWDVYCSSSKVFSGKGLVALVTLVFERLPYEWEGAEDEDPNYRRPPGVKLTDAGITEAIARFTP
jgi:hypothetical protein